MTALASPGFVAALLVLLGAAVHPAVAGLRAAPGGRAALAMLMLLLAGALAARAVRGGPESRLVALGVVLAVGGLAWDALEGHAGRLRLSPGQPSQNFEELGPGDARLGLRPLGFQAAIVETRGGAALLSLGGRDALVTPTRAVAHAGVRLGRPRAFHTGEAQRLQLLVKEAAGERRVEVRPGEVAFAGDLEVRLEQYFPDFALDDANQPFTRSREPRQPAALFDVRRGGRSFRVFVLASAPGIHQVEGLGAALHLEAVEAAQELELRVVRAPAAGVVLAGAVLVGLGLALGAGGRGPAPCLLPAPAAAVGVALCAALVALGGGGVPEWSWLGNRDGDALAIPAAGRTLGIALIATLCGTLLVAVPLLASGPAAPARLLTLGRRGLMLGATLAGVGAGVVLYEAGLASGTAHEAALLALLAGAVVASLASADAAAIPRAAAAGSFLLLAVIGVASWLQAGGYETQAVASAACVSLVALAVSE